MAIAMTRVYVAGASSEFARVRAIQQRVRELGGIVSHDWTATIEVDRARWPTDADVPRSVQLDIAGLCLRGIRSANVFWLLSSRTKSEGRTWEHCAAHHVRLARPDYRVIVSGEVSTVFASLSEWFATDEEALTEIAKLL